MSNVIKAEENNDNDEETKQRKVSEDRTRETIEDEKGKKKPAKNDDNIEIKQYKNNKSHKKQKGRTIETWANRDFYEENSNTGRGDSNITKVCLNYHWHG